MKKIKLLMISALTAHALAARAQTFSTGVIVTGTTNAPLVVNGSTPTNNILQTIPARTVITSLISNTNETELLSYGFKIPGDTNFYLLGTITNSFLSGTNGGAFTNNIPYSTYQVQLVPWVQAAIYTNTNSIWMP